MSKGFKNGNFDCFEAIYKMRDIQATLMRQNDVNNLNLNMNACFKLWEPSTSLTIATKFFHLAKRLGIQPETINSNMML